MQEVGGSIPPGSTTSASRRPHGLSCAIRSLRRYNASSTANIRPLDRLDAQLIRQLLASFP
jgi:hypothetical protein